MEQPIQTVDRELHPSGIIPTIQNIVATVDLGTKLDLRKIALNARNAEYNPKRFSAVIMRIREPKTTALVFGSGRLVCTGARSEQLAKEAVRNDLALYSVFILSIFLDPSFFGAWSQNLFGFAVYI